MNKSILCFGMCLFYIAKLAQADGNSCNCANKLAVCAQENLSRDAETDPLKMGKKSGELSLGKHAAGLNYGKKLTS